MGPRSVILSLSMFMAVGVAVTGQSARLETIATGVSSGAITTTPIEIELEGRYGIVLSSEDRVLRFIEPGDDSNIPVHLGLQVRVPVYRRDPPLFMLFGDRLAMGRADLTRRRGVLVRSAFDEAYGWTPAEGDGFPAAQFDRSGNIYLFSGTTQIVHMSAGGVVFWTRDLPAKPVAVVGGGGVVFAALQNGMIMRFTEHGTGEAVIRLSSAPISLAYDPGAGPGSLLVTETDGLFSRYSLADEEPRLEWARRFDASGGDGTPRLLAVIGPHSFLRVGAQLYVIDRYGADRWAAEVSGTFLPVDDERVLVLTDRSTVILVTRSGTSEMAHLDEQPVAIDLLPLSTSLFIRYSDWSWELRRLDPEAARTAPERRPAAVSREPEPTALSGLADIAMESTSPAQRNRILSIAEERIDSAELYGDVTTARRLAIDLLTEVSRGRDAADQPDIRRRAVAMLARYLDDTSRAVLLRVIRDDPSIAVVADAVRALADWGLAMPGAAAAIGARYRLEGDRGRRVLAEPAVLYIESLEGSRDGDLRALAVLLAGSDIDTTLRQRAVSAVRTVSP